MKNYSFFFLLLIFSFIAKSSYSQDFWEQIEGPEDQSIYSINANSSEQIFVGTNNGIFKTDNYGLNWEQTTLNEYRFNVIHISPLDEIFAVGPGVFYSNDNGETWDTINYMDVGGFAIYVYNENTIFVGNWGGYINFIKKIMNGELRKS
ncbi:MAG: hypothetical protein KAT48_13615 [Bacteroidales bacterium]|nr:hypothetical protein [Bacteroidales bacterium]